MYYLKTTQISLCLREERIFEKIKRIEIFLKINFLYEARIYRSFRRASLYLTVPRFFPFLGSSYPVGH